MEVDEGGEQAVGEGRATPAEEAPEVDDDEVGGEVGGEVDMRRGGAERGFSE